MVGCVPIQCVPCAPWRARETAPAPPRERAGQYSALERRAIESAHPYPDNCDVYEEHVFPNAVRLRLTFDERCRTEDGADILRIGKRRGGKEYGIFHGAAHGAHGWRDLVIEGDRFWTHFRSDEHTAFWGYRIDVLALTDNSRRPMPAPAPSFRQAHEAPFREESTESEGFCEDHGADRDDHEFVEEEGATQKLLSLSEWTRSDASPLPTLLTSRRSGQGFSQKSIAEDTPILSEDIQKFLSCKSYKSAAAAPRAESKTSMMSEDVPQIEDREAQLAEFSEPESFHPKQSSHHKFNQPEACPDAQAQLAVVSVHGKALLTQAELVCTALRPHVEAGMESMRLQAVEFATYSQPHLEAAAAQLVEARMVASAALTSAVKVLNTECVERQRRLKHGVVECVEKDRKPHHSDGSSMEDDGSLYRNTLA